jgi:hypothetical protein
VLQCKSIPHSISLLNILLHERINFNYLFMTDNHLNCFFVATTSTAATNDDTKVFVCMSSFFLGTYLGAELPGHTVKY